ncbi:MAG: TonB-dependent receptor [Calditrichaeota bacterium]|nr:TonB-dependent receptor [Calditrichota bacterium]RQV93582.1 MAG: TonB-dependent receptor [bacterium]RQW06686.1 MAG: TonB-dependent receptor [Calditrichota bacterium]
MKKIFLSFCLLSVLYVLAPGSEFNAEDSIRTYHLGDSILVLANRYELSIQSMTNTVDVIPVRKYNEVTTHSVLQLTDIFSPQTFVLEKRVVGYGVGSQGSGNVNIRGLGGKPNSGILVLINGRPDFMGIFGHPLPDVYGLNSVQQVEVIRGPSSTVFGSNAMGGVINLVTGRPGRNHIRASVQGGSYGTFIQNLDYSQKLGKTRTRLMVSHQATDGHIPKSGFQGWNVMAQMNRQFSGEWLVNLEGRYVPYEFDDPFMTDDPGDLGRTGRIRRGMVDFGIEGPLGRLKNSFHLYTNLGHHRFNDGFESHDFTYGFSSYQSMDYSSQFQLSLGLDALYYGGKARNVVFPQAPPAPELHTVSSVGGYLIGHFDPLTKVSIQAGLRAQYTSLEINELSPTAGISFLPDKNLKIFTSYQKGFRLPTLQELYLFPVSNPELKPERVNSIEIGTVLFPGRKNNLQLSWFFNDVNNIIQQTANLFPPPPLKFQNGGEAEQWGVESRLSFTPYPKSDIQISYSFIHPDNLTAFNPEHMFKYFYNQAVRSLQISLFGKYISDLYAENGEKSPLGDYHLMNISAGWPYRMLLINVQFRNLLDREYEILPGYSAPGFHILAGVTLKYPY